MCVQNGYNATKLFLFDVAQPIVNEEFQDVKEYSSMYLNRNGVCTLKLFAREDVEKSENTSTRISTASKNSTKETFVGKNPPRNIVELLDVAQGVTSVIVGTIIAIHEPWSMNDFQMSMNDFQEVLEEWTFTARLINGHDYCYSNPSNLDIKLYLRLLFKFLQIQLREE
ncbi:hypothetical protein Tco_0010497 [Tanacetum coccineum]